MPPLKHATHHLTSRSPTETLALGERLGRACTGGEILLLSGDLGAGKTLLVQGLARGLEIDPTLPVTSPTFVLHCQYPGRLELNHIDLYRLGERIDLFPLGFDDFMGAPHAVTAMEWADLLGDPLPHEHLGIHITLGEGGASREFRCIATGPLHLQLLEQCL